MRQSQKSNRPRNKNGRKPNGPSPNRVYESSGPEGKVRGTPQQIVEKYQSLARDKATAGDRVLAEAFLQHAEHYLRILSAAQPQRQEERHHEERNIEERSPEERSVDDASEEERGEEFAATSGDAPSDGMTVIGEDEAGNSSIVETPENSGGRRRGRRPSRRSPRSDAPEGSSERLDPREGASSESDDQTPPAKSGEDEVVVDTGIRAAE